MIWKFGLYICKDLQCAVQKMKQTKKKSYFHFRDEVGSEKHELCFYVEEGYTVNQITIKQFFYFEIADLCSILSPPLPLANPGLCGNNWIHLRFTEDSMPAQFYICMEIKRWNLVVVNSLSRKGLGLLFAAVFSKVSIKVCMHSDWDYQKTEQYPLSAT